MDDFIIQGDEPIFKIDSLGIGIIEEDVKKLSLSDTEYLVIGDRQGTTNYNTNNLDTKYNMYVNNRGVAINTSRNISSNYRDLNTSLYVGGNIQCDGIINAHSIQFSNISIKGDLNSNAIDLIKQIKDFAQSQPFRPGIRTYYNTLYNLDYPINNIYTPDYITLGGLVDTNNNQHPLNINSTPNNNFDNIHFAMRNDSIFDNITSNLSKLSIGIIGGSNISPAVISTTKGMPLEFHISKTSYEMNSLYNKNAIPTYLNDTQYAAMTIDNNGSICIGKNKADSILYNQKKLTNGIVESTPVINRPRFEVKGASKFDDIVMYDYSTNDYKNIDDIYIRVEGRNIAPSRINEGNFIGNNYNFSNISVLNNINGINIISSNITADILTANTESSFYGKVNFNTQEIISMESLKLNDSLYIGERRINPINLVDATLGYTTITNSVNGSNYFFTYVHSNIANLDANSNISFPNKMTVGPNINDGFPGVLNVFKNRGSNINFEVVLQEKVNTDRYITNIGRLSYLDFYDNSLIINTNNIIGKTNNIYFYPSFDVSKLTNNILFPNLINTPPMLSITNKGVGINIKIPRKADGEDLNLDINGKMSASGYYVSQNNTISKMAGFIYNDKNYFNIYNTNTYKYCINYDNVTSYSTKMQGLNVKQGINADIYYQNDKLIETLQITNNLDGFYTNNKIALGWMGEDVKLPLQIRNTNMEDYNYSIIRIYRGVRGGGIKNNADYSGIDICEYDRDYSSDRNLEKWFIYKNHKYSDIDARDVMRVGPLQFGYTDKTIEPTTFGMSMYYNSVNSNYHIDFNNPKVSYDYISKSPNTAVSIYGDLDVHGNINIIDNNSNNYNVRIKKLEEFSELAKYIDVVTVSNIIYKNMIDYNDVEYSGKNIILKPMNSIIVDSMINSNIPFVVKQNNDNYSAAKFITYSSNIISYSALELGIYKNNDYTTAYDADKLNNINNMVQFRVVNNSNNTDLEFRYFKNDGSIIYKSFLEITNNNLKTNMHLGQLNNFHNSNISLHINDDNKCGLQITNSEHPIKINLVNNIANSNKYNIISSGDLDNHYKFSIDVANIPIHTEPTNNNLVNIFTIDPYTDINELRDGVRYGFNDPNPLQTMAINSEHNTQTMLLNARYTKDYIYTNVKINTSNLKQTFSYDSVEDYWDNNSTTYKIKVSNSIHSSNIPSKDIYDNLVENKDTVVYKVLKTKKDISYLSIHSNIKLSYIFDENNLAVVSDNYSNYITNYTNITGQNNPKYIVQYDKKNDYILDISPSLSYANNEIIKAESTHIINNITSNNFSIVLNNGILNCNYNFACLFSNYYKIPTHLSNISASNTNTDITYTYNNTTYNNRNSNIVRFINKIYTYLPNINNNQSDRHKLFFNTTLIKLDDIGSLSNVYLETTTSNIVRYNSLKQYEGNFTILRNNMISFDSSNIIPNTISNSNYIINCNSNIVYFDNTNTNNNISNIINIRTSNVLDDNRYNTDIIYESPTKEFKYNFSVLNASLSNTIIINEYYKGYSSNSNINIQLTNYNRPIFKPHIILANTIKDDLINRNNFTNEIYSYDGNLKFRYSDEQFNQDQLLVDKFGNVKFFGTINTSNDLIISGKIYDQYGSNIIEGLDYKISTLEEKTDSNLEAATLALSSALKSSNINISNYVLSTSNILTSNILYTCNILNTKINLNDRSASNYVLATSNTLLLRGSQWNTVDAGIFYIGNIGIGLDYPETKLHIFEAKYDNTKLTIQNNFNFITSVPVQSSFGLVDIYTVKIFTYTKETAGVGSGQTLYTINVPNGGITCDLLMVGGGGAGGTTEGAGAGAGAGGGGGAVLFGSNIYLAPGNYNIKVGNGAVPGELRGKSTVGFGAEILGGGSAVNDILFNSGIYANNGGSGSGTPAFSNRGGVGISTKGELLANAILYNGNIGANAISLPNDGIIAGGGGGAGTNTSTGHGGDGILVSINGEDNYWGGGGAGGCNGVYSGTAHNGGLGGGGAGAKYNTDDDGNPSPIFGLVSQSSYRVANKMNAGEHTGGGGGGGINGTGGGNGGSGIIIIKYIENPYKPISSSIELIRGYENDNNKDYKIINNGGFKIMSSKSGYEKEHLLIDEVTENITLGGIVIAPEFIGSGHRLSGILLTSNGVSLSNYVLSTSNIIATKANLDDLNVSNFVITTDNTISQRISGLTTDMISEPITGHNKFIIDNIYNADMFVNGTLTVNSNLIIRGDNTILETNVYTTERLEVVNMDINTIAMMVEQKDINSDIFIAKNSTEIVFSIKNGGDIDIKGDYKKSGRNVISDTSNYVLATCNITYKKINDHVSTINSTMDTNDKNCSNYVLSTSNILATSLDFHKSKWTITSSNIYSMNNVSIGTSSNIDKLTVEGGIIASRGIVSSFSDNRLKDHTSNIGNPIDLICKLNGFHYTPNDLALHYGFPRIPDIGLSAQEVQSILPEIVKIAPFDMMRDDSNNIVSKSGDNYLTICYEKLAPLFVESIKALKKELNELKLEVAELRRGRD
jgi:hypothetical protein